MVILSVFDPFGLHCTRLPPLYGRHAGRETGRGLDLEQRGRRDGQRGLPVGGVAMLEVVAELEVCLLQNPNGVPPGRPGAG